MAAQSPRPKESLKFKLIPRAQIDVHIIKADTQQVARYANAYLKARAAGKEARPLENCTITTTNNHSLYMVDMTALKTHLNQPIIQQMT